MERWIPDSNGAGMRPSVDPGWMGVGVWELTHLSSAHPHSVRVGVSETPPQKATSPWDMLFLLTMNILICDNHKSVRPSQTDGLYSAGRGFTFTHTHTHSSGAGRAWGKWNHCQNGRDTPTPSPKAASLSPSLQNLSLIRKARVSINWPESGSQFSRESSVPTVGGNLN